MQEETFAVDVDELSRVIDRMATCEANLRDLATDIEHRVAALHVTWAGESADAQHLAQAEWDRGFAGMRAALGEMRTAARVAHDNYTQAVHANVQMWQHVR